MGNRSDLDNMSGFMWVGLLAYLGIGILVALCVALAWVMLR